MTDLVQIGANLPWVHQRIAQACSAAGRDPSEVTLVCVSKTVSEAAIRAAHQAGARVFGENYGQDLRDKARQLQELEGIAWHFIGPLQRNKVRYVVGTASLIHSVHSIDLLAAIEERAARQGLTQELLVQLNLSQETSKSGIQEQELERVLDAVADCTHCRCTGLMTMPPFFDDPRRARPYFERLAALRRRCSTEKRSQVDLRHLSMGMTGDFEVAIEEGATLVRIGTAIFGSRS